MILPHDVHQIGIIVDAQTGFLEHCFESLAYLAVVSCDVVPTFGVPRDAGRHRVLWHDDPCEPFKSEPRSRGNHCLLTGHRDLGILKQRKPVIAGERHEPDVARNLHAAHALSRAWRWHRPHDGASVGLSVTCGSRCRVAVCLRTSRVRSTDRAVARREAVVRFGGL